MPSKEFDSEILQNYVLTKQDVIQLFSRYGRLNDVIMKDNTKAFVLFANKIDAFFAQRHLNGFTIQQLGMKIQLDWFGRVPSLQPSLSQFIPSPPPVAVH